MITDGLVDEIAHLVWKEGHYSTPWAGWHDKERWRNVARRILEVAAHHIPGETKLPVEYTPCRIDCGQPEPCFGCDSGDYENQRATQ